MSYSNKLDLTKFISTIYDEVYVVMKLDSDFPNYYTFSDIDILASNPKVLVEKILNVANSYISEGWVVRVETELAKGHIFIDFYENDEAAKLDFRFDIHTEFPHYRKLNVKPALFHVILESRKEREVGGVTISVPSDKDELLLRYFDFFEWFETRPDKIKHYDYIVDQLQDDADRKAFLERLHSFVKVGLMPVPSSGHFSKVSKRLKADSKPSIISKLKKIVK